jgi:hypothetical protein
VENAPKNEKPKLSLLHQMEKEVLAEGQEWMQKRLQERLQKLAEQDGEISPPQRPAAAPATDEPGGAA